VRFLSVQGPLLLCSLAAAEPWQPLRELGDGVLAVFGPQSQQRTPAEVEAAQGKCQGLIYIIHSESSPRWIIPEEGKKARMKCRRPRHNRSPDPAGCLLGVEALQAGDAGYVIAAQEAGTVAITLISFRTADPHCWQDTWSEAMVCTSGTRAERSHACIELALAEKHWSPLVATGRHGSLTRA